MSLRISALILLSAFYIVYFAKMLMLKKQNIKGNILGKGDKPRDSLMIEIVLRFITFLIVPVQYINVILSGLIWSIPTIHFISVVGLFLMLVGVLIFLFAVVTMRNNWRAGYSYEQDTQLVTNGIYRFSRNPAFVGFDLLYIGCALVFPNIIIIFLSLVAVVLFHFQILGEEQFLAGMFNKSYLEYKAKTRRYL